MSELKNFQYTMESCNHCGQCKWILPGRMHGWDFAEICPIHACYGFDAYSGQGLVNIAREIMENKLPASSELADMVHTCTACGACDVNCKSVRDMEVLETIHALRHECAEKGFVPDGVRNIAENVLTHHNIYGEPHGNRFSWLPGDYRDAPDTDAVLFVGCSVYRHPETALAAIKILRAGGVKFRLLREEEWCCGGGLWRSGLRDDAEALFRRNVELFRSLGVKTVITACAECFGSFRAYYPRTGKADFQTLHITQVAAELIREGRLQLRPMEKPVTVTYHDPCMLGRLSEPYVPWDGEIRSYGLHVPEKHWNRGENGVYEPPREVLRSIPGVTLAEMPRRLEESWCCGASAKPVTPELASYAAEDRRREASSVGAEAIVSCCPFCRDALSPDGASALPYWDLTELLADRII